MTEKTTFTLANGLKETLHPPNTPLMKRLLETCTAPPFFKRSLMFAVEVKVKNETMYIIYWSGFITHNYIIPELRKNLLYALGYNFAINYNNVLHLVNNVTNDLLVQAIINNEKPTLAPLLYEQNSTTCWWKKYVGGIRP